MTGTSAARAAIRDAYCHHREIMGGLSMADLKLQAAAGLIDLSESEHAQDSPVWFDHAAQGAVNALLECDRLRARIVRVHQEIDKLRKDAAND